MSPYPSAGPRRRALAAGDEPSPLALVSSAFVGIDAMPGWSQPFATYQPVSIAVDAVPSLVLRGQFHDPGKVLAPLAWSIGIVVPAGRP